MAAWLLSFRRSKNKTCIKRSPVLEYQLGCECHWPELPQFSFEKQCGWVVKTLVCYSVVDCRHVFKSCPCCFGFSHASSFLPVPQEPGSQLWQGFSWNQNIPVVQWGRRPGVPGILVILLFLPWWFSGRILACYARSSGLIPGQCSPFSWLG